MSGASQLFANPNFQTVQPIISHMTKWPECMPLPELTDFIFIFFKDMGTVVLGKLESGSISKAQQLIMMPNRVCLQCREECIHSFHRYIKCKIPHFIRFSRTNVNNRFPRFSFCRLSNIWPCAGMRVHCTFRSDFGTDICGCLSTTLYDFWHPARKQC